MGRLTYPKYMDLPEKKAKAVGRRIREVRKGLGMTKERFASRLGIEKDTVAALERGEKLTIFMLGIICGNCKVSREWLLDGEGQMRQEEE